MHPLLRSVLFSPCAFEPPRYTAAQVRTRAALEALVRAANGKAQVMTGMTPAILGAAGLPVHEEGRGMTAAKPVQVREFQILHPESRKINLPFRETGSGGGSPSRGKPDGVKAIEFWVKVGAPTPAADSDLVFLKAFQRSPAQVDFRLEDIGKPLWVSARWVNIRGEPGVFSPIQGA